jgi:hypothetical protein
MFVLRAEIVTIFEPKMITISARNTNILKICKFRKAMFSVFSMHISSVFFLYFSVFFKVQFLCVLRSNIPKDSRKFVRRIGQPVKSGRGGRTFLLFVPFLPKENE